MGFEGGACTQDEGHGVRWARWLRAGLASALSPLLFPSCCSWGSPPTPLLAVHSAGASKYCSKCTHTEILLLLTDHQLPSRPWQPGFVLFHPSLPWVLTSGPGCSLVAVEKAAAARAAAGLCVWRAIGGRASVSVAWHDQLSVEPDTSGQPTPRKAKAGLWGRAGLLPYSPRVPAGTPLSD